MANTTRTASVPWMRFFRFPELDRKMMNSVDLIDFTNWQNTRWRHALDEDRLLCLSDGSETVVKIEDHPSVGASLAEPLNFNRKIPVNTDTLRSISLAFAAKIVPPQPEFVPLRRGQ